MGVCSVTDTAIMPIFPLPTVVFPGQVLPLHIFEDRYRVMIARCRETNPDEFPGSNRFVVVLGTGPHMFSIGCVVELIRVVTEYPDGRLDILTRGVERVALRNLRSGQPYARGSVEPLPDVSDGGHAGPLREQVLALATRLTELLCREPIILGIPPDEPAAYRLASLAGLDLSARQKLLETRSERERLTQVREALRRTLAHGLGEAPSPDPSMLVN